jgi:integrase
LNWLAHRADRALLDISASDVQAFRSIEVERVKPSTVNHAIKFLRMVFEDARRAGILAENPADTVKLVKRGGRTRRPFKVAEITRLVAVANSEWRSLIMFGLYTGQRLGDLARLTWANIDLQQNEVHLVTNKTGKQQIIPLAPRLRDHIETLPAGDNPMQPLHPCAFNSVQNSGKVGTLSRQFSELMASAGLVPSKKHRKRSDGQGRDGRREMSEISFHSLRHTATSLMKNAGNDPGGGAAPTAFASGKSTNTRTGRKSSSELGVTAALAGAASLRHILGWRDKIWIGNDWFSLD